MENFVFCAVANCFVIDVSANNQVQTFTETDTMFQCQLYQPKIVQNYFNNWNQVLKKQLTGMNINQKEQYRK